MSYWNAKYPNGHGEYEITFCSKSRETTKVVEKVCTAVMDGESRRKMNMKRTLTLTFEFDDGPWIDRQTGEKHPTDPIAYAMDQVNGAVPFACGVDFIDAKLDGEVLVDRSGYVSEKVQKCELQHRVFLEKVASQFF